MVFVLAALAIGAFVLLSERGVIPSGFLAGENSLLYLLDVVCVALCIGGTYVALRMMHFKGVSHNLKEGGTGFYLKMDWMRMGLIAGCIFFEAFVYFASLRSHTAHYAMFISLIASVFCIPSKGECKRLTVKEGQE